MDVGEKQPMTIDLAVRSRYMVHVHSITSGKPIFAISTKEQARKFFIFVVVVVCYSCVNANSLIHAEKHRIPKGEIS